MSLPSINFLHLKVSEIQAGQTSSRRPPAQPTDRPPIQTQWVKTIPREPLRAVGKNERQLLFNEFVHYINNKKHMECKPSE